MPKKTATNDMKFVRLAKKGDESAFKELFSRYHERLRLYLRHLGLARDECDDVLQEVFTKAFRALPRFDARRRFSPWIYRIAHNESVNFLKRRSRRTQVSWEDIASSKDELEAVEGTEETLEERWERREETEKIHEALDKLSKKDRELVVLRYFVEKSYAEISEILGVPENTVASRLHRAKEKLLQELLKKK